MFTPPISDLTKEQWDAIQAPGSVLLIACPGSGKTRTLTYKIAIELSKLDNPRQTIVAITYTNAAAEEIKERIEKLGAPTDRLWIGTIHSFCLEWVLRPYSLYHEKLKYGFTVLNAFDTEDLLNSICKKYPKPKITSFDCGYHAQPTGYKKNSLEEKKWASIDKVLEEYWATLSANRQVDFEQILWYSYQLIAEMPIIATVLKNLFPFILVDEFQDTKEIQYEIIFSILRTGQGQSKLLIVGDPNQSIFESMGGFPMPRADMEERLGFSLEQLPLSGNYRSSKIIIDYFEAYKTFDTNIEPVGKLAEFPSLITYDSTTNSKNLVDEMIKVIKYHVEKQGIRPEEICIAGPQWAHLATLTRSLMVKLPAYSFDGPGMAPFARDLDNFWYKVARILLTEPAPDMYLRRLRWAGEIIRELHHAGLDIGILDNKRLLRICNAMDINENDGLQYLEKAFNLFLGLLKLDLESCQLLHEHYISFFASARSRIARLEKEVNTGISTLINFKNVFRQRQGIKISTIHGVKGTEYDVVIGFGLLDDWVPFFADRNGRVNSQKMLYVLSSRARKNLHLFSETGRNINNFNPQGLLPTPCLWEYDFTYGKMPVS